MKLASLTVAVLLAAGIVAPVSANESEVKCVESNSWLAVPGTTFVVVKGDRGYIEPGSGVVSGAVLYYTIVWDQLIDKAGYLTSDVSQKKVQWGNLLVVPCRRGYSE